MSITETIYILFLIAIAAVGLQLLGKLVVRAWIKRSRQIKARRS